MLSSRLIQKRVAEIASSINSANYENLVLVVILNGSIYFASDLSRCIRTPLSMKHISIHMERNTSNSGAMKIDYNSRDIDENSTVLLVEDIVRSGITLHWLINLFTSSGVKSVLTATLLYVENSRFDRNLLTYVGFDVKNSYYIGYGLDFKGMYRNLNFITTLDINSSEHLDDPIATSARKSRRFDI